MKFIVQSCFEFSEIERACNKSWDLCFTSLIRWQVEQKSTYSLTFLLMLFQNFFFFNKSNVFSCSKWSTYESSWFCFKNSFLKNFERMYHLFSQRNKSFSIFHLKKKSKSIFLRIMFDSTSSHLIESWRSTFSFSLSCFIDAFSTKNRTRCANESNYCKINNTMRSFKNEALNVAFLLETFFIHFRDARSSLFATFSKRSVFEILSTFRDNDLKNFFLFKILSTIVTIFSFFKKFCAFLTIENFAQFVESLFAKQLLLDISSIVSNVFDAMLFTFDKNTCRLLDDEMKYFFFFFYFWKCFCFRSRFIFWDLNFHYFCFLSRSRSRNRVYETSRLRNCFFQIDILFLNRIRLIFFIIWLFYDWKLCWWRNF
jgi:hypothetical protein